MAAGMISPCLAWRTLVQWVQRPREGENRAARPGRGSFLPSILSGKRRERREAAALQIEPAPSMRALTLRTLVVPLDPQQLFEFDWPALCIELLGGVIRTRRELGVLQCAITSPSPRGIVRKNPRQQGRSPVRFFAGTPPKSRISRASIFLPETLASGKDQPHVSPARASTRWHRLLTTLKSKLEQLLRRTA